MPKAKASPKTMNEGAIEPALFTHVGYRLYVFDDEPCMLQSDLGNKLGYAEDDNIARLVERQWESLKRFGLVRQRAEPKKHGERGKGNVKTGVVNYFNERQVFWLTARSEAEGSDDLLEELIVVYDAWRKGRLVSRAEAAEAALAAAKTDPRPQAPNIGWPRHVGHEHSLFLMSGTPAAVPSSFVRVIEKDNRFTRFETALNITATATEDQIRIFDYDLGHAIGGQNTLKVRPRVREIQSALRQMGPDPWYLVQAYKKLGHSYDQTSVFILNHEQARAVAAVMDPHGHSDIHYRIDLLFYHIANGRLGEIASDSHGRMIADASDARARKSPKLAERYRALPQRAAPAALPPAASDPYQLIMIQEIVQEAARKALEPIVSDLQGQLAATNAQALEMATGLAAICAQLPDKGDAAAMRAEIAALSAAVLAGSATERRGAIDSLSEFIRKMGARLLPPSNPAGCRHRRTGGLSRLTPIKTPTIGFWPGESPGAAFGAFRYPSCTE